MKHSKIEHIYTWILLIIFGGIVIHAPLSVYLGTKFPQELLLVKSWKEILLFVAALLATYIITKRHMWKELIDDWPIRFIASYGVLHLFLVAIFHQGMMASLGGLAIDLRFSMFFCLTYLLIKIAPECRKIMLIIGAAGAVVVVGFGVLQLFLPKDILSHIGYSVDTISPYLTVDKNPDYVRINSTLRGPNPLGVYVIIIISFIVAFFVKKRTYLTSIKQRSIFVVALTVSLVVLWVSYSRSSFIGLMVALTTFMIININPKMIKKYSLPGFIVIALLCVGILLISQTSFFANVVLHDNANTGADVTSNEAHVSSIVMHIKEAVTQPLGTGIGSTGSASVRAGNGVIVENQYLFEAREAGWLGLGLFLTIYIFILKQLYKRRQDWLSLGLFMSGVGIAIIGLLLPVWADDAVSIIWWGLAGLALGGKYGK
jgi:hypothetical protein